MQLTPRYDGPPVLRFDLPIGDPAVPLVRQRRRLGTILRALDGDQWAASSRCDAWSVRDVVAHLTGVDQFWLLAITGALNGEPTRFLEGFDPVATPPLLVDGMADVAPDALLARYLDGVDALAAVVEPLDGAQWLLPGEAPPGHMALHGLARHALWDAWTHERDIVVPLGLSHTEEDDEIRACLEYAASIGPAFLAMNGSTRPGAIAIDGSDPSVHVVVVLGETVVVHADEAPADAVTIEGRSVDLIEAFTFRAPFVHEIPDGSRWMFDGLAAAFDRVSAG